MRYHTNIYNIIYKQRVLRPVVAVMLPIPIGSMTKLPAILHITDLAGLVF